ncbi:hypothetical protein JCM12294_01110 [Desulfocicer niacini]
MVTVVRQILPTLKEFKEVWKNQGPFKYALTSREFPPILLEPEEWLFSQDILALLKELMGWEARKMSVVAAPFNRKKQNILKPDNLSPWKINNFPEEWQGAICDIFTPLGHLTQAVVSDGADMDKGAVEAAFFRCLEREINHIGYVLLGPEPSLGSPDSAFVADYVREWEQDEMPD